MKTLLVGVLAKDRAQALEIAADRFLAHVAASVKEARPFLDTPGLNGIVVGVHFNDGDLFEFLRLVREHPQARALPFIVVKAAEGRLREASYKVIETACRQKGVPYLDAAALVRNLGPKEGYEELRNRIDKLIG